MADSRIAPPEGFEVVESSAPPPGFELVPPIAESKPAAPEDGPGLVRRFFNTVKGIPIPMATTYAGGALGTPLGPWGTIIGSMIGGGLGEKAQQMMGVTEPSKLDVAMSTAMPGVGKVIKPAYQLAKSGLINTLASRPVVAEAAENLLKRWINPATTAKDLYDAAEATQKMIPFHETSRVLNNVISKEANRMPLGSRKELLEVLEPIEQFVKPVAGYNVAQPVADAMADVRRLSSEASKAFKRTVPNNELGNAINQVRAARLTDLEKSGVPEVALASANYRKEMALEDIGRMIAKSEPGTKIRDFARDNPLFKGAFDARELELIDKITKKVQFAAPTGGAGVLGRLAHTAAGGIIGGGSAIGWLVGAVGPEAVRTMLTSPKGQRFIERTLEGNITFGPEWAAAAAMFARGLAGGAIGPGGVLGSEQ